MPRGCASRSSHSRRDHAVSTNGTAQAPRDLTCRRCHSYQGRAILTRCACPSARSVPEAAAERALHRLRFYTSQNNLAPRSTDTPGDGLPAATSGTSRSHRLARTYGLCASSRPPASGWNAACTVCLHELEVYVRTHTHRAAWLTVVLLSVVVWASCNDSGSSPIAPSFPSIGGTTSGATVHGRVTNSSGVGPTTLSVAPAAEVSGDDGTPGLTVTIVETGQNAVVGANGEFTITGVRQLGNVTLSFSEVPGAAQGAPPVVINLQTPLAEDETLEVELSVDGAGGVLVNSVEIENGFGDDDSSDDAVAGDCVADDCAASDNSSDGDSSDDDSLSDGDSSDDDSSGSGVAGDCVADASDADSSDDDSSDGDSSDDDSSDGDSSDGDSSDDDSSGGCEPSVV